MAVPELRFKEFTSDWSLKRIEEFSSKIGSGSTPLGGERAYIDNGIPFIRSQNVTNNELNLNGIKFISESLNSKMSGTVVKKHDLLLNITGASIGRSCVVPNSFNIGNVNQHVCIIRLKDGHNPYFFQPYLASDRGQKMIMSTQVGGGREGLNFQAIRVFEIYTPGKDEQTKIANFLTAVDTKISQLTKKHELLTLYKKGVMQKIFNQELRFQDDEGREFPEWKLTIIGEIANKVIAGGTPSTLKKEYWGGNIRWMNSGELNLKLVAEVENRITQAGLENSSTKLIPKNCVLIGLAGQGKTRGTVAMNLVELCTNQSIAAILPNPKTFDSHYLCQNLEARYDELRSLSAGDGGRGGLNLQIIKSMEINLPCLQEQAKIANLLTAIDDKIANVKFQLEAVKEYKRGLLQQMFI